MPSGAQAFTNSEPTRTRGTLIIEGGGNSSIEAVNRIVALVGKGRKLCYITTANPAPSSEGKYFVPFGLSPVVEKVTASNANTPAMAAELATCDGYYFDGGLTQLLTDAFIKNGKDTLALTAIRDRFENGAMVGGSSAGAMILGPAALCTCGTEKSSKVLHGEAPELTQGFNFLRTPIDAHVFTRNLYGRELATMKRQNWAQMLAIDESSAVEVPGNGAPWVVLGDSTVELIKSPAGGDDKSPGPNPIYDVSFLHKGDQISPQSFEAVTDGRKPVIQPADGLSEVLQAPSSTVANMASLVAGGQAEVYEWDGFWDANAPVRVRLARNDRTGVYQNQSTENSPAYMLTHLSFSVQILDRSALLRAVTMPIEARLSDDWGVPLQAGPRQACIYGGMTPMTATDVTVLDRAGVEGKLKDVKTVLINALPGKPSDKLSGIAGSVWLSGSGQCGVPGDKVDQQLSLRLMALSGGDLDRALIFYCQSAVCWHSYNAAERARKLGYRHVYWYRDGLYDWETHDGKLAPMTSDAW